MGRWLLAESPRLWRAEDSAIGASREAGPPGISKLRSTLVPLAGLNGELSPTYLSYLFSFGRDTGYSHRSSPRRPRSRWQILSAQNLFLPIKAPPLTTLTSASTQYYLFTFVLHSRIFLPASSICSSLLLFETGSWSLHLGGHSTKTQPQLPVTKHRFIISGPHENCRVQGFAVVRSPFSLRFENTFQVNRFSDPGIAPY